MYNYVYRQDRYEIYFNNSKMCYIDPKTLSLKNVRFEEGKETILHIHQILWTMNSNEVFPFMWDVNTADFAWEHCKSGLIFILSALNREKTLKCTSEVNFTNPNSYNRISFTVKTKLEVLENFNFKGFTRKIDDKLYGILEYTDPYPMHGVGSAVTDSYFWSGIYLKGQEEHTDNWRKRYRKIIFGNKDNYTGYILNHFVAVG